MNAERTLVTGFGPFRGVEENPSAWLAENSGRHYAVIPVGYAAARAFVQGFDHAEFDRWVMLGVSGHASRMRLELYARNRVGDGDDVEGTVLGPGPIDPNAPRVLGSTLWTEADLTGSESFELSADAGEYLCNYLYFLALARSLTVGFVHVPPFATMTAERQEEALDELLERLEAR
jgi:pyroglutamyl-peptidase